MRIKIFTFLIILISISNNIYTQEVGELNSRAEEEINLNSALGIYYAESALDKNIDNKNINEYIRSLYILGKSYDRIGDTYRSGFYLETVLDELSNNGYGIIDSDFYIFLGKYYYTNRMYDKLHQLLSNNLVISFLDEKGLIEFNILKINLTISENNEIDVNIIDQSIALCSANGYRSLEAQLYIIYGDYILNSNKGRAISYYNRALELSDNYFSALAYLKLGINNNRIEYIEKALLASEAIDDYNLIKSSLLELHDMYKIEEDFKNLAITIEKIKYLNEKESSFLINQYKELLDSSYYNEKLTLTLEEKNTQISSLYLVIISLGVAIIVLIIFLSIQSYRLRGFNL